MEKSKQQGTITLIPDDSKGIVSEKKYSYLETFYFWDKCYDVGSYETEEPNPDYDPTKADPESPNYDPAYNEPETITVENDEYIGIYDTLSLVEFLQEIEQAGGKLWKRKVDIDPDTGAGKISWQEASASDFEMVAIVNDGMVFKAVNDELVETGKALMPGATDEQILLSLILSGITGLRITTEQGIYLNKNWAHTLSLSTNKVQLYFRVGKSDGEFDGLPVNTDCSSMLFSIDD